MHFMGILIKFSPLLVMVVDIEWWPSFCYLSYLQWVRCITCKAVEYIWLCSFLLQISLFYAAVLAGLLHRFPVSFSQVCTNAIFLALKTCQKFGLRKFSFVCSTQLVRLETANQVVHQVQNHPSKVKQSRLLMLLVLMRQRRNLKKLLYVRCFL